MKRGAFGATFVLIVMFAGGLSARKQAPNVGPTFVHNQYAPFSTCKLAQISTSVVTGTIRDPIGNFVLIHDQTKFEMATRTEVDVESVVRGRVLSGRVSASFPGVARAGEDSVVGPLAKAKGAPATIFLLEAPDAGLWILPGGVFWDENGTVHNRGLYEGGVSAAQFRSELASTTAQSICLEDIPAPPYVPPAHNDGGERPVGSRDGGL